MSTLDDVCKVLRDLGYLDRAPPNPLAQLRFREDMDVDDLDLIDIVYHVEELTCCAIEDDELPGITTIGDLAALVDKAVAVNDAEQEESS